MILEDPPLPAVKAWQGNNGRLFRVDAQDL